MGEVWLAEQTRPVHRQVALKVIKAGMDTAQVVARFEAERQALALMDHPAIARVFDAGATPQGRPYFVMEYVRGEAITAYATRHKLAILDRIDLFLQVCEGVQHAHQKGIIHRDLKPSNILVTVRDDHSVPKIIDFGVAKATTQSADRPDAPHGIWGAHRHAGVYESGASRDEQRRHRHSDGCVFTRGHAIRVVDGNAAVRSWCAQTEASRRDPSHYPRGRSPASECTSARPWHQSRSHPRLPQIASAVGERTCAAISTGSR